MAKKSQNPEDDKPLKEARSEIVHNNAKANESKAGGSTVGKLRTTMYRPFGVNLYPRACQEVRQLFVRGAQMAAVEMRWLILMRLCSVTNVTSGTMALRVA